jgi:radical SAM superfamily enzyme YgiQ (UPF0313 family)
MKDECGFGAKYFRRRSPENVITELKIAKEKYAVKEVIFKDSIFGYDKEWLRYFLTEYRKVIGVPYKCFGKVSVFDEEIVEMLKSSQCYCVEFGVQTFNESLKEDILLRKERTESLLKVFEICEQAHLFYDADHIFGIPGERVEDHIQAAKIYAQRKYLNRIKPHNLVFYAKAKIYKHAPDDIQSDSRKNQDFFSNTAGDSNMVFANKCFQKYFKILPLLSPGINAHIQKGDNWRVFRFIPNIFIFILMLINSIKNGDKRFFVYGKYYPKKIFMGIFCS